MCTCEEYILLLLEVIMSNDFLLFLFVYLNDISIVKRGVSKSPTIIVLLSTSPFRTIHIYFINLGVPMLGGIGIHKCYALLLY